MDIRRLLVSLLTGFGWGFYYGQVIVADEKVTGHKLMQKLILEDRRFGLEWTRASKVQGRGMESLAA